MTALQKMCTDGVVVVAEMQWRTKKKKSTGIGDRTMNTVNAVTATRVARECREDKLKRKNRPAYAELRKQKRKYKNGDRAVLHRVPLTHCSGGGGRPILLRLYGQPRRPGQVQGRTHDEGRCTGRTNWANAQGLAFFGVSQGSVIVVSKSLLFRGDKLHESSIWRQFAT